MKKNLLKIVLLSALSLSLLQSCRNVYCNAYTGAPKQIIPIKQAIAMKNAYKNEIGTLIENNKPNYNATEFAYIELDTLKKYMAFLEKVQELNNQKITGIRLYFGQHPNNSEFKSEFPGRETVFFAPTAQAESTKLSLKFKNLENVPFYIKPNGANKLIGDFLAIEQLLNPNDSRTMKVIPQSKQSKTNNLLDDNTDGTSVILDDLFLTPPPKKVVIGG